MGTRTERDGLSDDERHHGRRAERYRADATTPIDDDDDEWWLPNEADSTAPDAPFRYRPGEGPSDR